MSYALGNESSFPRFSYAFRTMDKDAYNHTWYYAPLLSSCHERIFSPSIFFSLFSRCFTSQESKSNPLIQIWPYRHPRLVRFLFLGTVGFFCDVKTEFHFGWREIPISILFPAEKWFCKITAHAHISSGFEMFRHAGICPQVWKLRRGHFRDLPRDLCRKIPLVYGIRSLRKKTQNAENIKPDTSLFSGDAPNHGS